VVPNSKLNTKWEINTQVDIVYFVDQMTLTTKNWIYQNNEVTELDIEKYHGFVYLITNLITGRKYIGKKIFKFTKKIPPLKGKKRKRTKIYESDWKLYYGSSKALLEDVELLGADNFSREILSLHVSKSSWTYYEVAGQFERDVLYACLPDETPEYYNDNISGKFYHNADVRELKNNKA